VGHSHTIPKVLRHPEGARSVLLYLCERTGCRLRAKGLAGRVIHFGFRDPEMRNAIDLSTYKVASRFLSLPLDGGG